MFGVVLKEIEKMLDELRQLSTAGQLLHINVQMLMVDLNVFSGELVSRIDKYIELQNVLLKQARADTEQDVHHLLPSDSVFSLFTVLLAHLFAVCVCLSVCLSVCICVCVSGC